MNVCVYMSACVGIYMCGCVLLCIFLYACIVVNNTVAHATCSDIYTHTERHVLLCTSACLSQVH